MRLLSRYLLRQLAAPFVFALAALTSLMLLSQIAKKFGALVGKGLPWGVIGEVFALSLPFIVAMTLPMAVLLAVLYAFSHLAADNEITAMRASGISVYQILAPVLGWGVAMSVFNFAFVDQVLPRTNARLRGLLIDIGRKKPTLELREQVINEVPPSQYFLRAGRIDAATGRLRDITIYDMGGEASRRIIYADSGRMAYNEGRTDLNLRLYDGSIHQYRPSDPLTFQLTYYKVNDIRVKDVYDELVRNSSETVRGDREMSTCEMLTVMQDARRDLRNADRDRQALLISDLRSLLHLPPLPPARADTTPDRLPAYCGWIARVQTALTKTAEPRPAAQAPSALPTSDRVARQGAQVPAAAVPAPGADAAGRPGIARQAVDTPVVPPKGAAAGRQGRVPPADQLDAVRRRAARMGAAGAPSSSAVAPSSSAAAPTGGDTLGPAAADTRGAARQPGTATRPRLMKPIPGPPVPGSALPGQQPAGAPPIAPARPGELKPAAARPSGP
ncbi:MAG TPA: LptF/LptG family permease, partial [Gemmatimonadales bacterium]|nr:LptF/LptG family permease [Gemmatimonadales bacterium]